MKKLLFFLLLIPLSLTAQTYNQAWINKISSKTTGTVEFLSPLKHVDGSIQITAYDSSKVAEQIHDSVKTINLSLFPDFLNFSENKYSLFNSRQDYLSMYKGSSGIPINNIDTAKINGFIKSSNLYWDKNNMLFTSRSFPKMNGDYNVAFGPSAFKSSTGSYNTAIGANTQTSNSSGSANTYIGFTAGYGNTSGSYNTAIGQGSGGFTSGTYNTAVGASSLATIGGTGNTALGTYALANVVGNYNIGIGNGAGQFFLSGNNRLFINSLPRPSLLEDTTLSIIYGLQDVVLSRQKLYFNAPSITVPVGTVLGAPSGLGSNKTAIIFGDNYMYFTPQGYSILTLLSSGRVGINITQPVAQLHQNIGGGSYHKFTADSGTGTTSTDGFDVGIDATYKAWISQLEYKDLGFKTNNIERLKIDKDGGITAIDLAGTGDRQVGVDSNGKFKILSPESPVKTATITLTSSQLFNNTWVQLIPAQAEGKMAVIDKVDLFYNFNTVAFTTNEFSLRFQYYDCANPYYEFPTSGAGTFLQSTGDKVLINARLNTYALEPCRYEIYIQNSTEMIAPTGDGTLTITAYYSVIDI